jgi:hypothetical protein
VEKNAWTFLSVASGHLKLAEVIHEFDYTEHFDEPRLAWSGRSGARGIRIRSEGTGVGDGVSG